MIPTHERGGAPLAACHRFLSPDLVPHGARGGFERLVAALPQHLLWAVGFEARLGRDDRVDHFLGYDQHRPALLAETAAVLAGRAPGPDRAAWARLRSFGERWRRDERLRREVDHVWLEFDAQPFGAGAPGLFLERSTPAAAVRDSAGWSDRGFEILHEVSGFELGGPIQAEFRRCLAERPPSSFPSSLGFFLGRPHAAVRLCLKGLDPPALEAYLVRIGWTGDAARVRRILAEVPGLAGPFGPTLGMLHLDVTGFVRPRIGVELVLAFARQVRLARLAPPLLRWLREAGLCTDEKAAALETWPGAHFARVAPREPRQLYLRRVNHVKLEFDAPDRVAAKAYFGARMHMPRYLGAPDGRHAIPAPGEHLAAPAGEPGTNPFEGEAP